MAVLGILIVLAAMVIAAVVLGPAARKLGAQTRDRRAEGHDDDRG